MSLQFSVFSRRLNGGHGERGRDTMGVMDREEALKLLKGGPEGVAEWNKRRKAGQKPSTRKVTKTKTPAEGDRGTDPGRPRHSAQPNRRFKLRWIYFFWRHPSTAG